MKYLADKWEAVALVVAFALVAIGGYHRTQNLDDRLDRFEKRLFESTWTIRGNEIRCEPKPPIK